MKNSPLFLPCNIAAVQNLYIVTFDVCNIGQTHQGVSKLYMKSRIMWSKNMHFS